MGSVGSPFSNKDSCLPMAVSMIAEFQAQLSSIIATEEDRPL